MRPYGLILVAVLCAQATLIQCAGPKMITRPRVAGYTFQTNPTVWLRLAEDVCAAAVQGQLSVYQMGKNVVSASGVPTDSLESELNQTTLRPGAGNNTLAHLICDLGGPITSSEQVLSTFYGTAVPAFNSGVYALVLHGTLYMTEGWIIWSEWNKAVNFTHHKKYKDAQRSIDKAYALWYGHGNEVQCPDGMYNIADAIGAQMNTQINGRSFTNELMSNAHNDALDAIGRQNSTLVLEAAKGMLQVYVEFGLQFLLRNAYSADLGPKCQNQLMANLSDVFIADPDLTGPLMTASLALGASRASVDAYLAYCNRARHSYEGMLNVTEPIVSDIGRFAMSDLGTPNPYMTKLIWFFWTGIDIRNCTAV